MRDGEVARFTRDEWLDQARFLLPSCGEERRVELYEDMLMALENDNKTKGASRG